MQMQNHKKGLGMLRKPRGAGSIPVARSSFFLINFMLAF
jgi:hypothetical protein